MRAHCGHILCQNPSQSVTIGAAWKQISISEFIYITLDLFLLFWRFTPRHITPRGAAFFRVYGQPHGWLCSVSVLFRAGSAEKNQPRGQRRESNPARGNPESNALDCVAMVVSYSPIRCQSDSRCLAFLLAGPNGRIVLKDYILPILGEVRRTDALAPATYKLYCRSLSYNCVMKTHRKLWGR